jgi:hypothetical protein
MEHMYERLIEMLGKQQDDPYFECFVQELGEKPQMLIDKKSMREYSFPRSGFYVSMDKRQDQIKSIFFHLSTAAVASGSIEAYSGNLPAGIGRHDDRLTVRKKLAKKPRSERIQGRTKLDPKDYWEYYDTSFLQMLFIFDGATGRMDALSVRYTADNVPPEPPPLEPETYLQDRCTKAALKTIASAQAEARRLKHNYVDSGMLLLGLLGDSQSIPAIALGSAGVTLETAREEVDKIVGSGTNRVGRKIPYAYGAKHVLELALKEAGRLDREYLDSEHFLLGVIESGEGVAFRALENLGVSTDTLRNEVLRLIKQRRERQ